MMSRMMLLHCLVLLMPVESCTTAFQPISRSKVPVTPKVEEQCQGPCVGRSLCVRACASNLEGNEGFMCRKQQWRKFTDTCRTLSASTLFAGSKHSENTYSIKVTEAGKIQTISDILLQKCPKDLACIIENIQKSPRIPGNIAVIVQLLHNISREFSANVDEAQMQSYSIMANHILNSQSISNWTFIPAKNSSSVLLQSVNSFAGNLSVDNHPVNISELFIHTMGAKISKDGTEKSFRFSMKVNDTSGRVSGTVLVPQEELRKLQAPSHVISIAFPTLGAIMEASLLENVSLNGLVLSVALPPELRSVLLIFEKISKWPEARVKCVGWHAAENRWDESACQLARDERDQAICSCRHSQTFTSFSILMSPHGPEALVLTYITYVGLGISICSLIVCLFIEALVWRQVTKTEIAYLRHICIVNIAAALLVADMAFVAASLLRSGVDHYDGCVAVTFFIHLFYLSLFFWMLVKGLLILYGILVVFRRLRKSVLTTGAFAIGYGCPLVIAAITVAATEPGKGYLRREACWLNWDNTRALLAFVVPALVIVGVNLVTVLLVVVKTQRPSIGSSMSQDMRTVVRISKNVAILTPLLGLTWGFGIATVVDGSSLVFHIIFSLLNAFQGFFILVFGVLLDQKIRDALKSTFSSSKWISRLSEHLSSEEHISCRRIKGPS
ncbi:adhesion G-protein coupled receptor F2 [Ornithorhynchus anatinus]|uniref:Adhesion G protein-coupled receptor F2 n=1 Tax=Ornithorhynchus anatinus TaxID=9258 RepID=F6XUM8_ORNAN|nr:adhesion G-protein coupled receptor F2 [Ornithorhynchus anatinus]